MLKYLILQPLARVWIGTVDVFKSHRKDRIYMYTRMNIPTVLKLQKGTFFVVSVRKYGRRNTFSVLTINLFK